MSKFVFIYCLTLSFAFAQGPSPQKAVSLRVFSPKSRFDASKKFYSGAEEFSSGKFEKAYKSFSKASIMPNISVEEKDVAIYNSALSLERSKKYAKALDVYKKITNKDKETYYRISACCHEIKKWSCVLSGLKNWKDQSGSLSLVEEFEFRVRTGSAYVALLSYKDSLEYLETAVKVFNEKRHLLIADASNKEYTENKINDLGLWALDDLASAYKMMGESVKITIDEENTEHKIFLTSLKNQVGLKAYYYLRSQDTYLEMVQNGDVKTATKGLFMIGDLYQTAYKNFLSTGTPKEIKENNLGKEYDKELKLALGPLLDKAKTAFNKNIELADNYKINNEWIEKSKSALIRIKN